MNNREWRKDLEDVLNEYVASSSNPSKELLSEWIRRYPEYRQEIIDFTASWSLMNHLPPSPDIQEVNEETLVLRGMSIVQNLLHQQKQALNRSNPSLSGLLDEGKKQGLSIRVLAERSIMSPALIRKLDRRLIRFPSIPSKAIERIAQAISATDSLVIHYLQGEPKSMAGARYRSSERISSSKEQEDFFNAVREDLSMEEEQRRYWLALESHDESRGNEE